ncbi:hypothetical protein BU23DRAFT_575100 [Bimuria novae-zelandiae CBS 107.79]|uniref:alpha-galactosidase n=1 Tax=Bimuria novae-zelandiae CBS 107.79 TaxID=1447943 RepID=A0A6A5UJV7_9PLEO|nr:hypothetical protein BU23DRAFT_575100 [Bimuria novae-zelandiae CBS 107.79]
MFIGLHVHNIWLLPFPEDLSRQLGVYPLQFGYIRLSMICILSGYLESLSRVAHLPRREMIAAVSLYACGDTWNGKCNLVCTGRNLSKRPHRPTPVSPRAFELELSTSNQSIILAYLIIAATLLGRVINGLPTKDLPISSSVATSRINPSARQSPTYWTPPMKSKIQFILTGIPDVDQGYIRPNTGVYEIDIAATAESWRSDYKDFDKKELGKELPDWPGEKYLDIRRDNVFKVIKKRIDLAAQNGCDAIEPDNVDVYSNDNGFKPDILPSDTVAYLHKISEYARLKGMSVGIKTCIEILGDIFDDVDFAISEECVQYLNCTVYSNFTTAPRPNSIGKPVFEVEYVNYTYSGGWSDDGVALDPTQIRTNNVNFPELTNEKLRRKLCNQDKSGVTLDKPYLKINTVIKTLELDGFAMYCDGSVEKTNTKNVEGQNGPRSEDWLAGQNRRSWSRETMWRKMGGQPVDP